MIDLHALAIGSGPLVGSVRRVLSLRYSAVVHVPDGIPGAFTYRPMHLAVPPRSGFRYHLLVPEAMVTYEEIFIAATTALMNAEPATRDAVRCESALCELTSIDD